MYLHYVTSVSWSWHLTLTALLKQQNSQQLLATLKVQERLHSSLQLRSRASQRDLPWPVHSGYMSEKPDMCPGGIRSHLLQASVTSANQLHQVSNAHAAAGWAKQDWHFNHKGVSSVTCAKHLRVKSLWAWARINQHSQLASTPTCSSENQFSL